MNYDKRMIFKLPFRKALRCSLLSIFAGLCVISMPIASVAAWQSHSGESTLCQSDQPDSDAGTLGVVASVNPVATDAGLDVLRAGGNAVDAAIATALTLGVVDGYNSGIGGGCFILIRSADGTFAAIDGREMAPAAAHRDMYLVDGKPQPELSKTGPLAVGVPGALAAYEKALESFGTRELSDLLEPAAKIADEGFMVDRVYASRLRATAETLARFPGSRAVLLKPDGTPYAEGERLIQEDLAETYRGVAQHGTDWFYRGPIAERIGRWMSQNGGILTAEDFAGYEIKLRRPILSIYRDYHIVGFPPPSSGGVHVAQILNMLEREDLLALESRDPAVRIHFIAEAMKLAFADRAHWLGDADYVDVPVGLIDQAYANELRKKIDLGQTTEVKSHGTPPGATEEFFGKHTTHIATADADGNWVAITQTVNTTFGSKVIVPGTGVVLNNEMDDFSIAPGVPNAFGLIGAEANAVAPGKRPLSSMSPTMVLRDGEPIMTAGAAGGPKIITQVVLAITNHLDLHMTIEDAVAASRFHHQWTPDRLLVEYSLDEEIQQRLKALGHELQPSSVVGVTQAIGYDRDGKTLRAVSDPRVPGKGASTEDE